MTTKQEQRIAALTARRNLSEQERAAFSEAICNKLSELDAFKEASTLLAYAATWDEVDPSQFCERAAALGKTVAYPVSEKGGIMKAYAPKSPEDLEEGLLGIKAPNPEKSRLIEPDDLDLVIVPLVAFDEKKRRLGHGGGYYDRYLPKCDKAKFVAVAFEAQKLKKITTDEHDILMDMLVTEEKIY